MFDKHSYQPCIASYREKAPPRMGILLLSHRKDYAPDFPPRIVSSLTHHPGGLRKEMVCKYNVIDGKKTQPHSDFVDCEAPRRRGVPFERAPRPHACSKPNDTKAQSGEAQLAEFYMEATTQYLAFPTFGKQVNTVPTRESTHADH